MGSLTGKRALITGGASGIGRATALLFAREGAAVSVVDLDEAAGRAVAQMIVDEGGQAIFVGCDVSRAADCQRALQQTVSELGGLDILFNNTGIIWRATVLETTEAEWDRVMAVNVKSIFLLSKYAIPVMEQVGGGVIINTASGWRWTMVSRTSASTASAPAIPTRPCCGRRQSSLANHMSTFWQKQQTGHCSASAGPKRSLRRRSIWPVMPRLSSPVQPWW